MVPVVVRFYPNKNRQREQLGPTRTRTIWMRWKCCCLRDGRCYFKYINDEFVLDEIVAAALDAVQWKCCSRCSRGSRPILSEQSREQPTARATKNTRVTTTTRTRTTQMQSTC